MIPARNYGSKYKFLGIFTQLTHEVWLLLDVVLGVGLHGAEIIVYEVPNGKLRATKCSWLHTILRKSIL